MFLCVALKIVKKYPELRSGSVLGILARKPNAIYEKKSNIIKRSIKSVFAFICLRVEGYEDENEALQVLKLIWEDIARRSKWEIDRILGGLHHPVMQKQTLKKVVQDLQLQNLVYKHLDKLEAEIRLSNANNEQDPESTLTFKKPDQVHQLQRLISEFIVNMHVETQYMNKQDDSSESLRSLKLRNSISEHLIMMHDSTLSTLKGTSKYNQEPVLRNLILETITEFRGHASSITEETRMPYPMLILAIEMGNSKFVVELIRQYPDLIWNVDDNNHTIFHHAVKHRQEDIYNLLYEIGAMKDMIISHRDAKNNNMLHLVGKISEQKRLEDVSGVALQMQRELLWFQEVKNMIPPQYREEVNEDGLTPQELFTMEHKHLVTLGEKWMKDTASQCMVVATLIATIVFAAAFTIPGGYDQNNGIPIFHSKATFMVFVIADSVSLFSSSASIIMFLSILTSRYAERDFLKSLPNKLMVGLATLFLSIATMMITFSVSFFVLYRKGLLWTPILISAFAMIPVLLYIGLQSGLFFDVFRSTYRSRYLFKPQKHVLYYKTPMF
ncbi:putative PGG domain, ankyrin repeat-containing domain superfamily [Helianthus debilis subsp. tardiflorus]